MDIYTKMAYLKGMLEGMDFEDKKEKKKVEKTGKPKKIFGKNKKKNDSEEETIKIVSLADLRKESE